MKKQDGRKNNGGARPGSGAKKKEETTTTGFRVQTESLNILREAKYPLNAAVNDLVKKLAKKIKKD